MPLDIFECICFTISRSIMFDILVVIWTAGAMSRGMAGNVLTQIAAAQKALDGAARVITRNYLERCVTDAITSGDPLIYDELMKVIDRHR